MSYNKRKIIPFFLIFSLIFVSACSSQDTAAGSGAEKGLWFAAVQSDKYEDNAAVKLEVRNWDLLPTAEDLMEQLLAGPEKDGFYSPFPEGLTVLDLDVEDGLAVVNLSEQYGGLTGFELTLADYCIVLTLCQRSDIDTVRIYCDGEELAYRNRQDLKAEDIMLNLSGDSDESFLAALYFPLIDGGFTIEYRQITPGEAEPAETVLLQLISESGDIQDALPFPDGTEVLSLSVTDKICQVDLSGEFVSGAPSDEQDATDLIYSLVNTLCSLSTIDFVQLQVEGEDLLSYGPITLIEPLSQSN